MNVLITEPERQKDTCLLVNGHMPSLHLQMVAVPPLLQWHVMFPQSFYPWFHDLVGHLVGCGRTTVELWESTRGRIWPWGRREVRFTGNKILTLTHHPKTNMSNRSRSKHRGPPCLTAWKIDSFDSSRKTWNCACCLAISWLVDSFISFNVFMNTSCCTRCCSSIDELNDSRVLL